MNFDWKRPLAPILLVGGLLLCLSRDPVIGLGVFLVSFALVFGFSRGSSCPGRFHLPGGRLDRLLHQMILQSECFFPRFGAKT